jgi:hypothetical protein
VRPQTTRVRARGSGVACICDAAGRVPASLRELRIVVQQLSGGQQPTCQSRAPDAALPEKATTCVPLRSADRRAQLTRQSWLLAYPPLSAVRFGTQIRCRAGRPYLDAPRAALGRLCGCGAGPGVACLLCAIRSPQPCVPAFLPFRRGRVPAPYWRWAPSCAAGRGGGGPYAEDLACLGDRRARRRRHGRGAVCPPREPVGSDRRGAVAAAAGRRSGAGSAGRLDPGRVHPRSRQRRLAMAGADGLAAGGLVQLRPHRQRPDPQR